ncbi:MAG: hypothetical protein D6731_18815 [Planctomycetota bacterium]|nr:MAG: hypothetical protein D6731_18815 [Planctomycetota bacterium]
MRAARRARAALLAFFAATAVAPLGAEDASPPGHLLRYRFEALAGGTARYTVETELRQTVRHGEGPPQEGLRWRRDRIEQRFERRGRAGRIRQRTLRVELRVVTPDGEERTWDSERGEDPPEGFERAGLRRLHRTVVLEATPRGVLTRVRGAVDGLDRAAYQASLLKLPEEPVAVGAGWRRPAAQRVPYPPFGTLIYFTRYRLASFEPASDPADARWTVEATTTVSLDPDPPTPGQAPREVLLTRQEAGGTLRFDGNGLLLESRFRSLLEVTVVSEGVRRVERARSHTLQRLRSFEPGRRRGR